MVVTVPAVKLAAVPEIFVPTNILGVPKLGLIKVGEDDNTKLPEPVEVMTPVPPLATGNIPDTLDDKFVVAAIPYP